MLKQNLYFIIYHMFHKETSPNNLFNWELLLPDLQTRRCVADVLLLVRLIRGELDCPSLLSQVDFRIPSGTRSRELFGRRQYSRNYDFHGPLARMMRTGNRHCSNLDLFHDRVSAIRRGVLAAAQQDPT